MSKTRAAEKTVELHADRRAVWKALTEGEEIARWFAPEARSTPGQGGKIFVSWGPGIEGESKITVWEPERRLQTQFGENGETHVPLTVDYFRQERAED